MNWEEFFLNAIYTMGEMKFLSNRKVAPLSLIYTMEGDIKRFLIKKIPTDIYKEHLLPFLLLAVIVPQNVVKEIMRPTKTIKHDPLGWIKSVLDSHQFSIDHDRKSVVELTAGSIIERLTHSRLDEMTWKLVYFATMKRLEEKCFIDRLPYNIEVQPPLGKQPLLIKITQSNIYQNKIELEIAVTPDEQFQDRLATAMTYAIKFVRRECLYCHRSKCLGGNIFGLCGKSATGFKKQILTYKPYCKECLKT